MRNTVLAALCVCLVSLAADSEAATIYLNRASFDLANPTTTTVAVDGLVGTPGYPENYPFGTGHYTTDPGGITIDGIQMLGTSLGVPEAYILTNDVAGGALTLDGTDTLVGGRDRTEFRLPSGLGAFGMDFGLLSAATGPLSMTVFFSDASTASYVLAVSQRSQFVGVSGGLIDRIVFESSLPGPYRPYMLFDELTYASADVVATPEPASVALLGTGLLGLGFRCRRRTVSTHRQGTPTPAQEASTVTTAAVRFVAALFAIVVLPALASAAPILSTSTLNNTVRIWFTLPIQPVSHNALQFGLSAWSSGSMTTSSSLYDGDTFLGAATFQEPFTARFTDPASAFASPETTVSFGAIADGISEGLVVLRLGGTGSVAWDTDDVYAMAFGDAGGYPWAFPQISSASVSTEDVSVVPEPATLGLLGLGLSALGVRRQRQVRRWSSNRATA